MASDRILTITAGNFTDLVEKSDKTILVDFWASWCGPCKMIAPVLEELAAAFDGRALVGKVNVDEEPDLATLYKVMSIPTLMLFRGGQMIEKKVGAKPQRELAEWLETNI